MSLPVGLGMIFLRGRGESGGISTVSSEGVPRSAATPFPSIPGRAEPRPVKPSAQNWKKRESRTDTRREAETYRTIDDHA